MWPVSASGQLSHKSNAPFTPKLEHVSKLFSFKRCFKLFPLLKLPTDVSQLQIWKKRSTSQHFLEVCVSGGGVGWGIIRHFAYHIWNKKVVDFPLVIAYCSPVTITEYFHSFFTFPRSFCQSYNLIFVGGNKKYCTLTFRYFNAVI